MLDQVRTAGLPTPPSKYLHWDDLRRRTPPPGFDLETWWAFIKLGRAGRTQATPLADSHGNPFTWVLDDALVRYLHEVDLWGGGNIGVAEPVLNTDARNQYYLSSLMTEAITSSQIEGASTTREVAKEMLLSKRKPRDESERMIANNFATMQRIDELRDVALTPALVFELHRIVTADTLAKPDAAGRFRRADEDIQVVDNDDQVLHTPPPADQLERRLADLCRFANGESPTKFVHPVIRAVVVHFWLAWDHPFVDGNGRTARALFYWCMLRAKYWLFEYISISEAILRAPVKYGRAFLLTETDDNDLTYFVLYHLDVISQALETLRQHIAKRASDMRELEGLLRLAADRFNPRQRELLGHALRHPNEVYTVSGHQARQQVVNETARADLVGLADAGLLVKGKSGKMLVFRPAAELEKKLRRLGAEA